MTFFNLSWMDWSTVYKLHKLDATPQDINYSFIYYL